MARCKHKWTYLYYIMQGEQVYWCIKCGMLRARKPQYVGRKVIYHYSYQKPTNQKGKS